MGEVRTVVQWSALLFTIAWWTWYVVVMALRFLSKRHYDDSGEWK